MARAALRCSVDQIGQCSGLSGATIRKLEDEKARGTHTIATLAKLEGYYRSQGITFLPADADGPGLRIRDRADPPATDP